MPRTREWMPLRRECASTAADLGPRDGGPQLRIRGRLRGLRATPGACGPPCPRARDRDRIRHSTLAELLHVSVESDARCVVEPTDLCAPALGTRRNSHGREHAAP